MRNLNAVLSGKTAIVVFSLLGACAIHFVLTACGSIDGTLSPPKGTRDAAAQPAPGGSPPCMSWQIAEYYAPNVLTRPANGDWPSGLSTPISLPAGWEPIEAAPFGGSGGSIGALTVVRKCVQ